MNAPRRPGAQQQHYVPRHLLRGFLSNDANEARKEQVRVFDLREGKALPPTNIANIMGERRYNEWWVDDETLLTIEPGVGKIEHHVFPLISRIRAQQKLELSTKEHGDIALLLAFQFVRAKKMREMILRMDNHLRNAIEKRGWKMDQVNGYESPTEDSVKRDHTRQQIRSLAKYTEIMADKVFFLAKAPPETSLYLGDNPVVMANDEDQRPWGSIGIAAPFIQIYMPISSNLLLCAYSKEVLGQWMRKHDETMNETRRIAIANVMSGKLPVSMMKELLDRVDASDGLNALRDNVRAGIPTMLEPDMVDRYNSLQAFYAVRWVVDSRGRFEVAKSTMPNRQRAADEEAGTRRKGNDRNA